MRTSIYGESQHRLQKMSSISTTRIKDKYKWWNRPKKHTFDNNPTRNHAAHWITSTTIIKNKKIRRHIHPCNNNNNNNNNNIIIIIIIININTTAIDCLWFVTHIWNAPYGHRHVVPLATSLRRVSVAGFAGSSQRVSVAGSHGPAKPAFCRYRQGKLVLIIIIIILHSWPYVNGNIK